MVNKVEPIDNLISRLLQPGEDDKWNMRKWGSYACGTSMRAAGRAVALHPGGAELEAKYGVMWAAYLIFAASGYPDANEFFWLDDQRALKWLARHLL